MASTTTTQQNNKANGMGTYVPTAETQAQSSPIDVNADGIPVAAPTPAPAASPVSSLASGVGGILLFPGRLIVQQFAGSGDPLDMSHLPVTVLLSAAAWYGAWLLFEAQFLKPKRQKRFKKASTEESE